MTARLPRHLPRHRRWPGVALAAAAPLLLVTGCGTEESPSLNDDEGEVLDRDGEIVAGPQAPVVTVSEDVEVVGIELAYPLDGVYEVGEEAPLYAALTNISTEPVTLVDVVGPDFEEAISLGGSAEPLDAVEITVPPNDNTYIGAEGSPSIVLVGLETELRSSQSIPVTLVFEEIGEITVEVPVSAEDSDPFERFSFPDPAEDPSDN
jgi:copper(I)-binding protein